MGKQLAGVTFIKSGIALDYCFEASINSMRAFCDKVIVCYVESEDDTLEVLKTIPDIVIIQCSTEDWNSIHGKEKLSHFQNLAIMYAQMEGYEYVFLCQCDEAVHEDSIPYIKQAMALGEEAYYCSRYNMWGSQLTMLNVPQNRKPCSTVVNRLTKSCFRSVDDGESIATNTASLDFINLIKIYHVGFIREKKKHIAKIKEIQKNIFGMENYDSRADLKPEFDWKDWGFDYKDLINIPDSLPKYLKEWAKDK